MLSLYLLRHAEAADASGGVPDRERPLTAHGLAQAERVARWFGTRDLRPSLVLHSPARRVRETVAALARAMPGLPMREVPRIYNADPRDLFELVRELEAGDILLAGHNPGIHALGMMLAGAESESALLERLAAGYPPATLAMFEMPGTGWDGLKPGGCRLADLAAQG